MRIDWHQIAYVIVCWLVLSVLCSSLKAGVYDQNQGAKGNCGKDYQIDYIIATNLFCEIGSDKH